MRVKIDDSNNTNDIENLISLVNQGNKLSLLKEGLNTYIQVEFRNSPICINCGSSSVYTLKSGKVTCRRCGYIRNNK